MPYVSFSLIHIEWRLAQSSKWWHVSLKSLQDEHDCSDFAAIGTVLSIALFSSCQLQRLSSLSMCSWELLAPAGGWPRAQLRVEDAKMILDVEKVKMLAWQTGLLNRRLGAQAGAWNKAPEGSMNLWLGPLLVLIPVVFGFRLIRPRSCFRQSDQESSLEVGIHVLPAGKFCLSAAEHGGSSKRLAAQGMAELLLSRYKQSRCKGSTFGRTVLVCLTQPLCHGHKCGATPGSCCCPRSGWKHLIVPTLAQLKKKKVSCPVVLEVPSESASGKIGEEELFAELYGLLIGASPTLGVCTTPDGQPRLISAFLPETCFQHVQRIAFMGDWPMCARWKFVNDVALAIWGMHAQGLAHCDLKPDNVLAQSFPCTWWISDARRVQVTASQWPASLTSLRRTQWVYCIMGCVFSRKNPTGTRRGGVGVVQVLSRPVLGNVFAFALWPPLRPAVFHPSSSLPGASLWALKGVKVNCYKLKPLTSVVHFVLPSTIYPSQWISGKRIWWFLFVCLFVCFYLSLGILAENSTTPSLSAWTSDNECKIA